VPIELSRSVSAGEGLRPDRAVWHLAGGSDHLAVQGLQTQSRRWWPQQKRDPARSISPQSASGPARTSAEKLKLSAGFEATHVPFRGGPEALTEGDHRRIDFYFCPINTCASLHP